MSTDPIVKTVRVSLPPDRAFDLFTSGMDKWWPVDRHSVSAGARKPAQKVSLQPGQGGQLEEIAHDGASHVWGHVTEWEPGATVAFTWHPGRAPSPHTHVRITFVADDTGTLVTLTHAGWEALAKEDQKNRNGYDKGWVGVLDQYKTAA